jgi:isocitrate dehydrogenase
MTAGDFYGSENSLTMAAAAMARYEFVGANGKVTVLKEDMPLLEGEILDTAVMHVKALRSFYEEQTENAKQEGLLLSLHLKATMMKVSHPVMFGHMVGVYFLPVFEKHAAVFAQIGVSPENGLGDLNLKIQQLPEEKRAEIEADIRAVYAIRPPLAMVDSDRGIMNPHVPSDVIIDASIPAMIRDSGKVWGRDGKLHETKTLIPDRCYATTYKAIVEDCRQHGAFDPAAMGSVPNVGLWAQKARNTVRMTRPSLQPVRGRSESSTRIAGEHCWSRKSNRVTFSARARRRRSQFATG